MAAVCTAVMKEWAKDVLESNLNRPTGTRAVDFISVPVAQLIMSTKVTLQENAALQLDPRETIALVAIFAVGVLAGILIGTGMTGYTARGLPEVSWTLHFQLEDRLFAKAMPPLMLGTLAALAAACLLGQGASRLMFGVATLCMLLVLVITVGFEVPLNKQIQSWTAGSAPADWTRIRDIWQQRHLLRTISAIVCFVCALLALVV